MSQLYWLDTEEIVFPPTSSALKDPDGLLAVGGDLTPERLVKAYSQGIFPWYSEGQPLLWWTPDPRLVLFTDKIHIGRTLRKLLRKQPFTITVDREFEQVMKYCGTIARDNQDGSWITDEMLQAYVDLHQLGIAHSVEAWQNDTLVGGLYGVALGRVFFGESMFSLVSGASKVAFSTLAKQLCAWQFELIDCQIHSDYLASFGASEISRSTFEALLRRMTAAQPAADDVAVTTFDCSSSAITIPLINWQSAWQMPERGFDGTE